MSTIKTMIANKLRQESRAITDDIVRGKALQHLEKICRSLPDETLAGQDFAKLIFKLQDEWHEKAVAMLVVYATEETNDLAEYPHIKQILVEAINGWR